MFFMQMKCIIACFSFCSLYFIVLTNAPQMCFNLLFDKKCLLVCNLEQFETNYMVMNVKANITLQKIWRVLNCKHRISHTMIQSIEKCSDKYWRLPATHQSIVFWCRCMILSIFIAISVANKVDVFRVKLKA